ncbi:hypothetical protein CN138_09560 [Sinorhizobium meliloti]|uniref:Uncharacterized protein n=1 Tax=Rhizobium meliloti (strain 1021) TaxID=266834 RepID=Q92Z93_RHIME|nr:hypothetical protein SMa1101 [Sinorhizobium meliloti 1021]AGG70281.1 Hypothetical protein SM2011_a1101 [Sinorhizobium meliloti 2011]ASP60329.1 hypothetical protein CDO30_18445 [Sinorhizobium meliloti]RVE95402.1 hypothetical protein CN235_11350 [Sinorhizobium meliloti]RVG04924.1 hypothetical protein CN234_26610 [Sinorhizobium meliloti]
MCAKHPPGLDEGAATAIVVSPSGSRAGRQALESMTARAVFTDPLPVLNAYHWISFCRKDVTFRPVGSNSFWKTASLAFESLPLFMRINDTAAEEGSNGLIRGESWRPFDSSSVRRLRSAPVASSLCFRVHASDAAGRVD